MSIGSCLLHRGIALGAVLALTLGATACGESDEDRVRAAVESLQEDFAAGDIVAVCDAMSDRSKQQVGRVGHQRKPTTCRRDMLALLNSIPRQAMFYGETAPNLRRLPKPEVTGVEISGTKAIAETDLNGHPLSIPMIERDGEWQLDDFFVITGPVRPDLD